MSKKVILDVDTGSDDAIYVVLRYRTGKVQMEISYEAE